MVLLSGSVGTEECINSYKLGWGLWQGGRLHLKPSYLRCLKYWPSSVLRRGVAEYNRNVLPIMTRIIIMRIVSQTVERCFTVKMRKVSQNHEKCRYLCALG
jgi:hypothetical protein